MGSLIGHVAPGFGFFIIGFWHLLNHIKLHILHPNSYTSWTWFPISKSRYLELYLIMAGSCVSISMELFIGPRRHQPFDPDGNIPNNHLRNFEHFSISLSFLVYASFAIVLDRAASRAPHGFTLLVAALAFGQELLLFHFHSIDHMSVEGQYHLLLEVLVLVSMLTTLMGIAYPKSFTVSFVRSVSILFQGVWFIVMGVMIWTPQLVSKGCFMNLEDAHYVVRCQDDQALRGAKALANLQFSWSSVGVTIFSICMYLGFLKIYVADKVKYHSLAKDEGTEEDRNGDVEAQTSVLDNGFKIPMGKGFAPMHI